MPLADPRLAATRAWVEDFVVAHSLCPFAGREVARQAIRYRAVSAADWTEALTELMAECRRLDAEPEIATTLVVLTPGVEAFDDYLELLAIAEALLADEGYEGVYQLASFHPDYCFEGTETEDPANYTNRSPWPMLHLLREADIERALAHYSDPESIPERNVALLRRLGREALAARLDAWQQGRRP